MELDKKIAFYREKENTKDFHGEIRLLKNPEKTAASQQQSKMKSRTYSRVKTPIQLPYLPLLQSFPCRRHQYERRFDLHYFQMMTQHQWFSFLLLQLKSIQIVEIQKCHQSKPELRCSKCRKISCCFLPIIHTFLGLITTNATK
jgi:hypothetical protein